VSCEERKACKANLDPCKSRDAEGLLTSKAKHGPCEDRKACKANLDPVKAGMLMYCCLLKTNSGPVRIGKPVKQTLAL
jgi:hypothetical protein